MRFFLLLLFLLLSSILFSQDWKVIEDVTFIEEEGVKCKVIKVDTIGKLSDPANMMHPKDGGVVNQWVPPQGMTFVRLKIRLKNSSMQLQMAYLLGIRLYNSKTGETHEVEFPGRKSSGGMLRLGAGAGKTIKMIYYYPKSGAPPAISCDAQIIQFIE